MAEGGDFVQTYKLMDFGAKKIDYDCLILFFLTISYPNSFLFLSFFFFLFAEFFTTPTKFFTKITVFILFYSILHDLQK